MGSTVVSLSLSSVVPTNSRTLQLADPVPGTWYLVPGTRYQYPVFTSGQSTPSNMCRRTTSRMVNSRRDTQVDVDVSLRMRDRGWSRDCQQLPARRVAAHQQEDEIAQAVEHSDASRRAASAGPPRGPCACRSRGRRRSTCCSVLSSRSMAVDPGGADTCPVCCRSRRRARREERMTSWPQRRSRALGPLP